MTNHNERLDKILADVKAHSILVAAEDSVTGYDIYADPESALVRAKQAITSLIKELVAEAKPDKLKESDYTLNMRVPHNPPSNTTRTNLYRKGYNDSLDQFEYNLLKVLGYEDEK